MHKITYKGQELTLRFGWGAQYLYEAMSGTDATGRPVAFDPYKLFSLHTMLYAALSAANRDTFTDDFGAFVDELDAHPAEAQEWCGLLLEEIASWGKALQGVSDEGKKKEAAEEG